MPSYLTNRVLFLAVVFGAAVAFAACGDDASVSVDASTVDATSPFDAAVCVSSCTTDQQCQSTCPQGSIGINCCDTATGTCYQNAQATCPAPPPPDAGVPMY